MDIASGTKLKWLELELAVGRLPSLRGLMTWAACSQEGWGCLFGRTFGFVFAFAISMGAKGLNFSPRYHASRSASPNTRWPPAQQCLLPSHSWAAYLETKSGKESLGVGGQSSLLFLLPLLSLLCCLLPCPFPLCP